MLDDKVVKCYRCRCEIVDEMDYAEKVIPMETKTGRVMNYRRGFHQECLPIYLNTGERLPEPKKVVKPKKLNVEEVHKCYYCTGVIGSVNDIAWKKFPLDIGKSQRKWVNRKLHVECLIKYNDEVNDTELLKEENSDWDLCYKYFRKELLGLPETTKLQQHEIRRLLGLRMGLYYPQGTNTRILPRGYSFKTILVTMKVIKPKIQAYLTSTNFANHKHRVDGILRFIAGEINDVQKRMDMQSKSNEKLVKDVVEDKFDYTANLRRKESSTIKSEIDDLGGLF